MVGGRLLSRRWAVLALGLLAVVLAAWIALPGASRGGSAATGDPRPCHVPGVSDLAVCYMVSVPEDWSAPAGRRIGLYVAVLPATTGGGDESALFVLAGGPGQAATELGDLVATAFDRVRETRAIILMDARGTGRSGGLDCPALDEQEEFSPELAPRLLAECRTPAWSERALQHYGTPDVVRDVEAVRQALGYERLDLWGGSWGTRTALLYMREHPERVRSAVLDGVAPPQARLLLREADYAQAALDALLAACSEDPGCTRAFPGLRERFAAWMELPGLRPITALDPLSGQRRPVDLDRDVLAQMVRGALYSADTAARLPFALDRLIAGDATPLITLSETLTSSTRETMYIGATLSALCAEEVARTPAALVRQASAASFTRDSYYRFWALLCRNWPTKPVPAEYAQPVRADVPVLVLSGGADPITPPAAAQPAIAHLPRAAHLVAPGVGHNVSSVRCADRIIARFIREASAAGIDGRCLRQSRPPFVVSPAGPPA